MDVLVTDRGQVVGLRPEDFEVKDEGVLQDVDLVARATPVEHHFGLDVSEGVNGDRLEHLQSAGAHCFADSQKDDRAALLTFSHAVRLRQELTSDIPLVQETLAAVTPSGQTSLVDGTYGAIACPAPMLAAAY